MELYPIDWKLMYDEDKAYAVCINENQDKVAIHVENVDICCYVKLDIKYLKNNMFINDFKSTFSIIRLIAQKKYSLIYYSEEPDIFTKIYFSCLKDFYNFKSTISKKHGKTGIYANGVNVPIVICEDSLSFILKLLTKKEIRFGEWIHIKNFKESQIVYNKNNWKEYVVNESDISKSSCKIIPLTKRKIVSFDIECYSNDDKMFPNALEEEHIIMMISVVIKQYDFETSKREKHIFSCVKLNNIDEVVQHIYKDEISMLYGCIKFMTTQNADFIIGYNIWNFDFKYIDSRLERIDVKWEEITDCNFNETIFMKYIKNPDSENILITSPNYLSILGTICLDLYPFIRRTTKLDSYKLDNVCKTYLNRGKHDIHYTDIFKSYRTKDIELLTKVAEYAIEDSNLVIDLFDKTNVFVNLLESSKIYNIPIVDVFGKGQSIRVESQVYYIAHHNNYVMENGIKTNEEYEGAVVQDPIPGLHNNILTFDFASLYPSIIRAYNLCYTTIIDPSKQYEKIKQDDIHSFDININDDLDEHEKDEEEQDQHMKNIRFVKSNVRKGLLPILLENLVNQRKAVKAELEKETDPIKIRLLDATQNAIKSSANSVYGILGSKFGRMGMVDIARVITFQGRQLITVCANYLREKYNAKIVYGDSVMPYTPVIIKQNEEIKIVKIKDICDDGWEQYEIFKEDDTITSNRKDKQKIDLNNIYAWTDKGWSKIKRLIRHKCNKSIMRVRTDHSIIDVTSDHSLITSDNVLIKPNDTIGKELLTSNIPWDKNYDNFNLVRHIQKGTITKSSKFFEIKDQLIAQQFIYYLKFMGYHYRVFMIDEVYNIEQINERHTCDNIVKEVRTIAYAYDGYVYDIETEEGVFQAGIGNVIVKNTDSIMVDFKIKQTSDSTELGHKISKELSSLFPPPLQIEFEKCYVKYFLISKKRYAGYKYKENGNHVFDIKGLASTRRDSFPYFKNVFNKVINNIMIGDGYEKIRDFVFDCIYKLLTRQVPIEELIMTGEVAKSYKNTSNCPMKLFVDNMKRDGIIIEPGQRIAFVYVREDFKFSFEKDKVIRDRTKRKDGNYMRMYDVYKNKKDPEPIDYEIYISKMVKALDKLIDVAFHNNNDEVVPKYNLWIADRLNEYCPDNYVKIKNFTKYNLYMTDIKYFELQIQKLIDYKRNMLHVDISKYFEDKSKDRRPSKRQVRITDYLLNLHAIVENRNVEDEDETFDL